MSGQTDQFEKAKILDSGLRSYGHLDVTFNNAGTEGVLGPITELDQADWARTVDVNLKGTWLSMKQEIAAMAEWGGAIVNVAAIAAMAGMAGTTIYAASKGGVIAMTRAAAIEWAARRKAMFPRPSAPATAGGTV